MSSQEANTMLLGVWCPHSVPQFQMAAKADFSDEIRRRINYGMACYYFSSKIITPCTSQTLKIIIYKSIILILLCIGMKFGLLH
jgi:hypothetical protein